MILYSYCTARLTRKCQPGQGHCKKWFIRTNLVHSSETVAIALSFWLAIPAALFTGSFICYSSRHAVTIQSYKHWRMIFLGQFSYGLSITPVAADGRSPSVNILAVLQLDYRKRYQLAPKYHALEAGVVYRVENSSLLETFLEQGYCTGIVKMPLQTLASNSRRTVSTVHCSQPD
ncbi:hypothetical protein B9Z19DRAFT_1075716 [Tuber borchii]|uniref:Uncharacterized protein n=1 Tax=Tuber borchii TaxID=42251 RepID=A0A2T7A2W4_TUBBO|nr:hypothetical protein B9Z19DRAFT_1075716 [Tuber borchii]